MSNNAKKPKPLTIVRKDETIALSYVPARGYSWPAAAPDNLLAVRHGAYSPRLVAERAAEIRGEILRDLARLRGHDDEHGAYGDSSAQVAFASGEADQADTNDDRTPLPDVDHCSLRVHSLSDDIDIVEQHDGAARNDHDCS